MKVSIDRPFLPIENPDYQRSCERELQPAVVSLVMALRWPLGSEKRALLLLAKAERLPDNQTIATASLRQISDVAHAAGWSPPIIATAMSNIVVNLTAGISVSANE